MFDFSAFDVTIFLAAYVGKYDMENKPARGGLFSEPRKLREIKTGAMQCFMARESSSIVC